MRAPASSPSYAGTCATASSARTVGRTSRHRLKRAVCSAHGSPQDSTSVDAPTWWCWGPRAGHGALALTIDPTAPKQCQKRCGKTDSRESGPHAPRAALRARTHAHAPAYLRQRLRLGASASVTSAERIASPAAARTAHSASASRFLSTRRALLRLRTQTAVSSVSCDKSSRHIGARPGARVLSE